MSKEARYAKCIRCAHIMTMLENNSLRTAVDCPSCGAPKQFGESVYVPDFQGYTLDYVIKSRRALEQAHGIGKESEG
jgi:DNA-directed RNA polymerase subunit RPC12/RpoP